MNGQETLALVDLGCDHTFVWEWKLGTVGKLAKGETPIKCTHGDILGYPSMTVKLTVDGNKGEMKVCVSLDLLPSDIRPRLDIFP